MRRASIFPLAYGRKGLATIAFAVRWGEGLSQYALPAVGGGGGGGDTLRTNV